MKKVLFVLLTVFSVAACTAPSPKYANRAEAIAAQIHDPHSKYVVVTCHRGDWRNFPENSIPAIESIIRMYSQGDVDAAWLLGLWYGKIAAEVDVANAGSAETWKK